jgi:hypothetical protein
MSDAEPEYHRLAKKVRIERFGAGKAAKCYIDGKFFPYYTQDAFHVNPKRGEIPSVTFTLVASTVEVVDSVDPKEKTDEPT